MSDGTRRNLTAQQERALVRLLSGASIEAAARSAHVSRQTCSNWVNHFPLFADELRDRQGEALDRAVRRLAISLERAAVSLTRLTTSRDEAIRLRASVACFEVFGRTKETAEFEERLARVESLLNGATNGSKEKTA